MDNLVVNPKGFSECQIYIDGKPINGIHNVSLSAPKGYDANINPKWRNTYKLSYDVQMPDWVCKVHHAFSIRCGRAKRYAALKLLIEHSFDDNVYLFNDTVRGNINSFIKRLSKEGIII